MCKETTDRMDEQNKQLRTLNFDTITCQYVDITKDGRVWHLRDDVPSEVMLRLFVASSLQSIQARLAERFEREQKRIEAAAADGTADPAEVVRATVRQAAQDEVRAGQAEIFDILGEIVRHTPAYRQLTTEELSGTYDAAHWSWRGGTFSLDEAQQICQLFSQLRSLALFEQQSAQRQALEERLEQARTGTPTLPTLPTASPATTH